MTALATHLRPQAYTGKTFTAFRLTNIGAHGAKWRTCQHEIDGLPATIDEALNAALASPKALFHKDQLLIRETEQPSYQRQIDDPSTVNEGKTTLHLYAIKRKATPDYVREGHETRRVQRLYAEKVCEIDGSVFG